jgi:hypothetical protein
MAVRTATSDPKPSIKPEHAGFLYFYYNKRTQAGSECAALIPKSLQGIVKNGFIFDDAALAYDTTLKASVLQLDFDEPAVENPSLPPDEQGWADHDHLTAQHSAEPEALRDVAARSTTIPNRGSRPATSRKHNAAARAAEHNIDVDLLMLLDQACAGFNYACRRIGTAEKPRAMEAQKILVTCMIPWLKQRGVLLSDEDEKGMNFS